MRRVARAGIVGTALATTWPSLARAADFAGDRLSLWWMLPFVGLLASIAVFPLVASRAWHAHFGKVAFAWSAILVVPLAVAFGARDALHLVAHAMLVEYVPLVALLFALYTVSGGIGVLGDLRGTPASNTALLATGTLLANVMGTTGASMVLVRPLIRANADRAHNVHVLVFFIFLVSNAGGALTPLGDPPLFIGFANGVSFFWTTGAMLAPALVLWSALLALFFVVDRAMARRDGAAHAAPVATASPLRLEGRANLALLAAVVVAVVTSGLSTRGVEFTVLGTPLALQNVVRDVALLAIAWVSLRITPASVHAANGFNWAPMREVAGIFAAIFVTMIPALAILGAGALGPVTGWVTTADGRPDHAMYFWITGVLSAFLDNAPTYLAFFHVAGGDAKALMAERHTLTAISAGAVFMGALSYIGNAPNFMVRAIAVDRGIRMPSFVGYMAWSCGILLPLFLLLTVLFFP